MDLTIYTEGELKIIQKEIEEEMQKRNNAKQKEAWTKVKTAIQEYTAKYGDIHIYDGYDAIDLNAKHINDDNAFRNVNKISFDISNDDYY